MAEYLVRTYGGTRMSFAALLKERMVEAGVDPAAVYKAKPPLVRELLQVYGQVMRAQDEDYWIDALLAAIDPDEDLVVVDDMRFRNEAIALREEGFMLVRIERSGGPELYGAWDISEIDLDDWEDWDAVITADWGDLMTLFEGIDALRIED